MRKNSKEKMTPEMSKIAERVKSLSKGKRVAIFGAGSSGRAVAALLGRLSIESDFYEEKGSKGAGVKDGVFNDFGDAQCKKHALIVYSPAFRPDCKWLCFARERGLKTICEPDLSALCWRGKIVAITGTDGKTTLTKLIAKVLNDNGVSAICAGNIGTPLCDFETDFDSAEERVAVCELSSFQTMRAEFMRPDAVLWTNFGDDHLDWHKSLREYFEAKLRLAENLRGKILIAGTSVFQAAKKYDLRLPDFALETREFDVKKGDYHAPFDSRVQGRNFLSAKMFFECANKVALFGDKKIDFSALKKSAESFELPAHRFGSFIEASGVKFYDDSKATNTHSAIAAIEELEGNIVWLGGGKDKNCDLSELADLLSKKTKGAVLIGQTAGKLKALLDARNLQEGAHIAQNMDEAVKKCLEIAKKIDARVLFSPAFSSFGMFDGYAERGKSFINAVLCLKNSYNE